MICAQASATTVNEPVHVGGRDQRVRSATATPRRSNRLAAAQHWSDAIEATFAVVEYHDPAAPTERVLAYLDLRASLLGDVAASHTCLVGTMAQEGFETSRRSVLIAPDSVQQAPDQ